MQTSNSGMGSSSSAAGTSGTTSNRPASTGSSSFNPSTSGQQSAPSSQGSTSTYGQGSQSNGASQDRATNSMVDRAKSGMDATRQQLQKASAAVQDKLRGPAQSVDTYVQDQPWRAVGIAAAAGLVLGLLISNSRAD